MPVTKPHVGAIGVRILVRVKSGSAALDVSSATVKEIKIRPPGQAVMTRSAVFLTDGVDGQIYYDTVEGEMPVEGIYQVQGFIRTPTWEDHTARGTFEVAEHL